MSNYDETFIKELERNQRIRELAEKNNSPEGLTDAELNEFIRLVDRAAYIFGRS